MTTDDNTATSSTENPATVVTVERIISYCGYENKMQANVYPGRIKAGKIKADTARLNYKIIREVGRMAAKLKDMGYEWDDLMAMVAQLPNKGQS